MAVYQISRIQVRRGQMQAGTGLPQLASGELAWAIDTQELFIGNGSVSEGAPEVGNTKIITVNDNIFDIYYYQYKQNFKDLNSGTNVIQTGVTPYLPTMQAVSDVLDRIVWAEDFGIAPTTQANSLTGTAGGALVQSRFREQFQRAINELYLNSKLQNVDDNDVDAGDLQKDYRVELRFTPGLYVFDETIYLPSYVKITGAGVDRTFFRYTGTGPAFAFVNEDAKTYVNDLSGQFFDVTPTNLVFADYLAGVVDNATLDNQPKFTGLNNFTLVIENPVADGIHFQNVRNSEFSDIRVIGPWVTTSTDNTFGLKFFGSGLNSEVTCTTNKFSRVTITGFETGAYALSSIRNNHFFQCRVEGKRPQNQQAAKNIRTGFIFGAPGQFNQYLGPINNIITDCTFDYVDEHAIHIQSGTGNKVGNNVYINVGEDSLGNAVFSHVLIDVPGNSMLHDTFDRYHDLSANQVGTYYPEVEGIAYHQTLVTKQRVINALSGFVTRLPLNLFNSYKIDYLYSSTTQLRKGTLNIAIDDNNGNIQLTDEYECTNVSVVGDPTIPSQLGESNEGLVFNAEISVKDELIINYVNNSGQNGILTYAYTVLVHS